MNLLECFNKLDLKTDKGTTHDYIAGYYNNAFTPFESNEVDILEVGVDLGLSAVLWKSWFKKLNFIGVDIEDRITYDSVKKILDSKNINLMIENAYSFDFIAKIKDKKFDFIIEDGPHTLPTQLFFIEYFYPLLKPNGKLIVEDIQYESDLYALVKKCVELNYEFEIFDFRQNKGRYDDVILEIIKHE